MNKKEEKEHTHKFEPVAYFWGEKKEEEWLIVNCFYCGKMKTIVGKDLRGFYE